MKTLIIVIIASIIAINLKAQIKVNGYIETGLTGYQYSVNAINQDIRMNYVKDGTTYVNLEDADKGGIFRLNNTECMYSEIVLNFSYKNIYLEQTLYNIFTYSGNGYTFKPLEVLYSTRLYYKYKFLEIGGEHMCSHPIINQHNEIEPVTRRMSHDKLFIRFTFNAN